MMLNNSSCRAVSDHKLQANKNIKKKSHMLDIQIKNETN